MDTDDRETDASREDTLGLGQSGAGKSHCDTSLHSQANGRHRFKLATSSAPHVLMPFLSNDARTDLSRGRRSQMVSSGLSVGAGLRRCLAVFAGVVLQRRGWVTTVVLLWISNAQISNPMSSRRDLTKKDPGSCVFAFMLGFGDMVFNNKYPEMLMWHRDWELPVESAATPQKITYVMICTHIYVYRCWVIIWCKFGLFEGLLSGQSLFFKHCLSKAL